MSFITVLFLVGSADASSCHCPGMLTFSPAVKTAWFNTKHDQDLMYNKVSSE